MVRYRLEYTRQNHVFSYCAALYLSVTVPNILSAGFVYFGSICCRVTYKDRRMFSTGTNLSSPPPEPGLRTNIVLDNHS